jgi:hypothetical protein
MTQVFNQDVDKLIGLSINEPSGKPKHKTKLKSIGQHLENHHRSIAAISRNCQQGHGNLPRCQHITNRSDQGHQFRSGAHG